jgi:hypothetical protein
MEPNQALIQQGMPIQEIPLEISAALLPYEHEVETGFK